MVSEPQFCLLGKMSSVAMSSWIHPGSESESTPQKAEAKQILPQISDLLGSGT